MLHILLYHREIFIHGLLTVGVDEVGEEEVELPDGDVDVVGVDTEAGVEAVRRLL